MSVEPPCHRHPDERAYFYDDPELGISRTEAEEVHWARWRNRYRKCIVSSGKSGGCWLDAACGSGYGAEILASVADHVTGVDIDSVTIRYARKHHSNGNISFERHDFRDLPAFWAGRFDTVVSIETIEHVADSMPFFKAVRLLLKADGVFVVTTPESQCGGGPNPLNPFHLHEYSREQLDASLRSVFGNVRIETETAIFNTGVETVQLYAICRI